MNRVKERHRGICSWALEDRPREKLLIKGREVLSDAELLAIIMRSGTSSLNAVDLAKKILDSTGNDLHELARLSVNDLMKLKGVGQAKALSIVAAIELGRRRRESKPADKSLITCSREAFELLRPHLQDIPHESFWVILLNRANRVVRQYQVSKGGIAGTVADPKLIFKNALDALASGIIVAHNHPSGNLNPSQADIDLTQKLKDAGKLLDIQLLDHLIISGQRYFSFADEGIL